MVKVLMETGIRVGSLWLPQRLFGPAWRRTILTITLTKNLSCFGVFWRKNRKKNLFPEVELKSIWAIWNGKPVMSLLGLLIKGDEPFTRGKSDRWRPRWEWTRKHVSDRKSPPGISASPTLKALPSRGNRSRHLGPTVNALAYISAWLARP